MKVTINSGGRVVEIETDESGMTAAKLAKLAEGAWKRTAPATSDPVGAGLGFTSQLGVRGRGPRHFRIGAAPMDAS